MSDERVRGRFVWHELMTSDVPAAISFYTEVVGWSTQSWDMDSSYTMWIGGDSPVGGVMLLPEQVKAMGAPPHWLSYIGTPDVDATAEQARGLGAIVLKEPDDVPNGGRFAILQDPQGAVFAIYRPAPDAPPPSDDPAPLGDFSWHELATTDLEAGFEFYRQLFGWEVLQRMDMGPELGTYLIFGWGGEQRGGMYRKPANMPAPPHWLAYARIPDARATATVIGEHGGTIINGPMEVPGGDWIVMAMDPQGVAFAVHSKAPAAAAASPPAAPAAPAEAEPAKPKAAATPKKKAAAKPKKKAAAKPKKKAAAKPKKKAAAKPKKKAPKAAKKAARKAARKAKKKRAPKRAKKAARRAPKKAVRRAKKKAARRPARKKAAKKKGARKKVARRPARRAPKRAARRGKARKRK